MEKILYVSSLISEKRFEKISKKYDIGLQANKFDRLFARGFSKLYDTQVYSFLTLNNLDSDKLDMLYENEKDLKYVYPYLKGNGIKKYIQLFKKTFNYCKNFLSNEHSYIVINLMSMTTSFAAILASKLKKKKCVGILTDLPEHLMTSNSLKQKIKCSIHKYIINRCDSYVFLAEAMKQRVHIKNKEYIIIEGCVDSDIKKTLSKNHNKYDKKVCHYAGMIYKKYGVAMMVNAFIKADVKDSELHIYGKGDYVDKLLKICEKHKNIKYFGLKPNEYVICEQQKSSLLINPRTNEHEFSKYSFPSKNMEYIASSTPTMICKLESIPDEYDDFAFILQDQTADGMAKMLKEILNKEASELKSFGEKAQEFVLNNKSNIIQAKKILDFAKHINNIL